MDYAETLRECKIQKFFITTPPKVEKTQDTRLKTKDSGQGNLHHLFSLRFAEKIYLFLPDSDVKCGKLIIKDEKSCWTERLEITAWAIRSCPSYKLRENGEVNFGSFEDRSMTKHIHEIRDPVHVFVRLDTDERKVLDSRPFQRLRQIHQLAMTYLVYPGATHRRFEHSLGVMELASRVFDIITKEPIHDKVRYIMPQRDGEAAYWRRVLRMAALCHDLGHLPFSHAAEKELLPKGWDHERLTARMIKSGEMEKIWGEMRPALISDDIIKIALGPQKAGKLGLKLSDLENILSEIITGDTFGVDRMDYLLRDSLHAGVVYGKFDHYRLIDTLCILPKSEDGKSSTEPTLGLDAGGIQSAEALLWARYFMYSQVYFHPVRRIYDIHLKDFLKSWLPKGKFTTKVDDILKITDCEVIVELRKAALDKKHPGHIHAKRIMEHKHFKRLYERNPVDQQNINLDAVELVYKAACEKFGKEAVRRDTPTQKGGSLVFPILKDGKILTSTAMSVTLAEIPVAANDFVFIDRDLDTAEEWLKEEHDNIIKPPKEID